MNCQNDNDLRELKNRVMGLERQGCIRSLLFFLLVCGLLFVFVPISQPILVSAGIVVLPVFLLVTCHTLSTARYRG